MEASRAAASCSPLQAPALVLGPFFLALIVSAWLADTAGGVVWSSDSPTRGVRWQRRRRCRRRFSRGQWPRSIAKKK